MKTFWTRFYANPDDPRPVIWPPAFPSWCSGYTGEQDLSIVCALVKAKDEKSVWALIETHFPETEFEPDSCNEVKDDFTPGDRFPEPDYWDFKTWTFKGKR